MAYSSTVNVRKYHGRYYIVIDETDVQLTSEAIVSPASGKHVPPPAGAVIRVVCVRTGGSAATVNPILMLETGGMAGTGVIYDKGGAVASVNQIQKPPATYFINRKRGTSGLLYHRSRPSAAGANISTRYEILPGWEMPS